MLLLSLMRENECEQPDDLRKGSILTLFSELYRGKVDALLHSLPTDRLILLMTSSMRKSMRDNGDEDYKTMSFLVARELARRQVDPLPFLVAAKLLDVPE